MVYFDNGATTFPKPPSVLSTAAQAMSRYGANPGRGGYPFAIRAGEAVYRAREKAADFFGAPVDRTAFTLNCTHALNFAVKGVYYAECERREAEGGHIVISDIEHNAVLRPVHALSRYAGASYTAAETFSGTAEDDERTVKSITDSLRDDTVLVALTAAGNVTGQILPLSKIYTELSSRGITLIVDAAQAAGILPLKIGVHGDIICAAGHKGLYGVMGTGVFAAGEHTALATIIEGGTGSRSGDPQQPEFMPDRFESGTGNTAGVIALGAGLDFVRGKGLENILSHETQLCRQFVQRVSEIPNVVLYTVGGQTSPVVSFNIDGMPSETLSEKLGESGFCLRGGLHCAYLAHKKIGTLELGGTVRFAPSVWSKPDEVAALANAVAKIAR